MGQTIHLGFILALLSAPWMLNVYSFQTCKPVVVTVKVRGFSMLYLKRNRQGDLLKKLEIAKEQARQRQLLGEESAGNTKYQLSAEDIKIRNDRKRFEELLKSESATSYDMENSSAYKTLEQEEEEMNAGCKFFYFHGFRIVSNILSQSHFLCLFILLVQRLDRLFEGDPAPITPFEDLVNIKTEKALGKNGIQNILPWLHKNSLKQKDFVVIITDPRDKSSELRATMKSFFTGLAPHIQSRMVIINADSPLENRKYVMIDLLS